MINRELIRLKIVQLVYAHHLNAKEPWGTAKKDLEKSLEQAQELYIYLLNCLVELHALAHVYQEVELAKAERLSKTFDTQQAKSVEAIVNNKFLIQLTANIELTERRSLLSPPPIDEDNFISNIFQQILQSTFLQNYIEKEDFSYESSKRLVLKIFRRFYQNNELLNERLEENHLYWNDDKHIIDSFVEKTIKKFEEEKGSEQPLLPAFSSSQDETFAFHLFEQTLAHKTELTQLIESNLVEWDLERLVNMDICILLTALSEILYTDVPLRVTFNEYLNLAKVYSTPESALFINGILDTIVKKLREQKRIIK